MKRGQEERRLACNPRDAEDADLRGTCRLYGKEVYHRPSRFIEQEECVEEVRLRATVSRPVSHHGYADGENDSASSASAYATKVTIVNMEGSGEQFRWHSEGY